MSFHEHHKRFVQKIERGWNRFIHTNPDKFIDVPHDFIYETVVGNLLRRLVYSIIWLFLMIVVPLVVFCVIDNASSNMMDTDDPNFIQLIVYIGELDLVLFLYICYKYFITADIPKFVEKSKVWLLETDFRKFLNTPSSRPLIVVNCITFILFLYVLWHTDENSSTGTIFLLLVSFYVFWQGFYFTGYKHTAQLLMTSIIVIPIIIARVESRPDLFPDSPLHKKEEPVKEVIYQGPTGIQKYAKLYEEYYGMTIQNADYHYDVESQPKMIYTVYNESVDQPEVILAGRITMGARKGATIGAKMFARKFAVKQASRVFRKASTRALKIGARRLTRPLLKVSVPAKKAITKAVTKQVAKLKPKLEKLASAAKSKRASLQIDINTRLGENKKAIASATQRASRSFAESSARWEKAKAFRKANADWNSQFRAGKTTTELRPIKVERAAGKNMVITKRDISARGVTKATTGKRARTVAGDTFTHNRRDPYRSTPELSKADHYNKHCSEFRDNRGKLKYNSADEYAKAARDFLNKPPEGTLTGVRRNGDVVRFNEATGEYAVMNSQGKIQTYMKPQPYHPQRAPEGFDTNDFANAKEYFYGTI